MVLFVYKHDLEGLVMLKFNSVVDTLTSLNWHSNKQVKSELENQKISFEYLGRDRKSWKVPAEIWAKILTWEIAQNFSCYQDQGRVPLGFQDHVSGSESAIQNHSDHSSSNEPMNPWPEWIHICSFDAPWSEWSKIIDPDPDHARPQRNVP